MKKILMTLAAAFVAVAASAQVYVGGSLGINSTKIDGEDDATITYKFLPEIGYKFSDSWAAGVNFGWAKEGVTSDDDDLTVNTFEVNPYARFTFVKGKVVNVFCDGSVGYKHYNKVDTDLYSIGLRPGVSVNIDKFSIVAHVGFFGWNHSETNYKVYNKENTIKTDSWVAGVDGTNLSLGLFYNF